MTTSTGLLATETDVADPFDPRVRPWYVQASEKRQPIWTEAYVFFESRKPGITTAAPVIVDGELVGVVGADVYLSGLATFLGRSENQSELSVAYVISAQRELLAYPGAELVVTVGDCAPASSCGDVR